MKRLTFTIFLFPLLALFLWTCIGSALAFPIGALMVLPLIYFGWRQTLVYVLVLTLVWESTTPLPLGSTAGLLTSSVLLLQLFFRHQLRANFLTRAFTAILLQSVVVFSYGRFWPSQTFSGAALQFSHTLGALLLGMFLALAWLGVIETLSVQRGGNLNEQLKDL